MPHASTPIAVIGTAFGLGIVLKAFIQPEINYFYAAVILLLLGISHVKKWHYLFLGSVFCCFLFLGMIRHAPSKEITSSQEGPHDITIIKPLNTSAYGYQYIGQLHTKERTLVQTQHTQPLTVGDRIRAFATLTPIEPPKNPFDFDFKRYLLRKGIVRKIELLENNTVVLPPKQSMKRWAHKVQLRLISQLHKTPLHQNNKALIMALVLGHKAELSEERKEQYQRAGAMHLLAISGLHIGIVLILFRFAVRPFKRFKYGTTITAVVPLLFLWCFVLITGGSASVSRAVTMFSFLQLGLMLGRKNAGVQSVWVSFVVLLFVVPQLIFDVGFQLSYAAVFGIVWMMPHWQRLYAKQRRVIRYTADLLGVGCIAQLAILPLSLYYFHQFPLLFWVSNLVLVPLLGLIIVLGIGCLGLSFFTLKHYAYTIPNHIIEYYQNMVAWIAQWEQFFIHSIPFRTTDAILLGVVVLVLFLFMEVPTRKKAILLGVTSILFHGQLYWTWKHPSKAFIAHVYKNSLVLTTQGDAGVAYYGNKTTKVVALAQRYQLMNRLDTICYKPLQNTYDDLVVIDSIGVYTNIGAHKVIMLRQSPKVHLIDLIDSLQPIVVIADGSNYPSFVSRWQKTCAAKNITFHATASEGGYPLN